MPYSGKRHSFSIKYSAKGEPKSSAEFSESQKQNFAPLQKATQEEEVNIYWS